MAKSQIDEDNIHFDNEFKGPVQARKCTDIVFFFIFILSFACMNAIGLGTIGYIHNPYVRKGNPLRLIHGIDYKGSICGIDENVQHLPNLWNPNFTGMNPSFTGVFVPTRFSICVATCPSSDNFRSDPYGKYGSWWSPVATTPILGNCIPADIKRSIDFAGAMFGDFIRASDVICATGFPLAVVVSILFLVTIRIPLVLRAVVWICAALVFFLLAAGGYILLNKAKEESQLEGPDAQSTAQVMLLKGAGGTFAIGAILWLSVICLMRHRIALAISIVRESAKALTAMPLLCFFPLIYSLLFAGVTALWMVYSIYLASAGNEVTVTDPITSISYVHMEYDDNSRWAMLYLLFCWLWLVGFLEAFGQLTAAHAVLVWYFSKAQNAAETKGEVVLFSPLPSSRTGADDDTSSRAGKNRNRVASSWQVVRSAGVCCRYHLGTAAMGSFLVALVQTARILLEYIQYQLKSKRNVLVRAVLCCISCCLWCLEKCLKFLTKHAYIQSALFGTPFCSSARRAFSLIIRNLGRVAAVGVIGDFVVLIGKLSITLTCIAVAYLYEAKYMNKELSGFVLPIVLVGAVSYGTCSLFLGVLSATCNTLLQAFIVEEEMSRSGAREGCGRRHDSTEATEDDGLRQCMAGLRKENEQCEAEMAELLQNDSEGSRHEQAACRHDDDGGGDDDVESARDDGRGDGVQSRASLGDNVGSACSSSSGAGGSTGTCASGGTGGNSVTGNSATSISGASTKLQSQSHQVGMPGPSTLVPPPKPRRVFGGGIVAAT